MWRSPKQQCPLPFSWYCLKALDEWGWHQGGFVMFRPTKYKLLNNVIIENSIE
jgi:hypothetical protein